MKNEARKKFYQMELWIQDNPEKALRNSQEEFQTHSERAAKLEDEALKLKELTRSGAIESIQISNNAVKEADAAIIATQEALKNNIDPLVQTLVQKLKSSKDYFEEKNRNLKAYFADINKNLTQSNALISKLNSAV